MQKLRIAVLFGGSSSEHDISLKSAFSVLNHFPHDKFEAVCIGITKKGRWLYFPGDYSLIPTGEWENNVDCCSAVISPDPMHGGIVKLFDGDASILRIDAVFPVLHGKFGEDGTVQAICELAGLPCVGCGMTSSAICMDKAYTHAVLDNAGIRTAKHFTIKIHELDKLDERCGEIMKAFSFPLYVKPTNAGSSIGVSRAESLDGLKDGIKLAFSHHDKVIVEEAIVGKEVECAVFGNENPVASIPGEIVPANEFYDFESKYESSSSKTLVPADISPEQTEKLRKTAIKAYQALDCSGMSRVDFFVNDDEIVLNEVNTIPGFTDISLYPKMMEASGTPYGELIEKLILLAIDKRKTS